MLDQDKLDKLPAYARNEINRLREEVGKLTAKNAWLESENRLKVEKSNTIVTEGLGHDTAIPSHSNVEFHLKNLEGRRWKAAITVKVSRDGDFVEIMGSDSISIKPESSNFIRISLRDN